VASRSGRRNPPAASRKRRDKVAVADTDPRVVAAPGHSIDEPSQARPGGGSDGASRAPGSAPPGAREERPENRLRTARRQVPPGGGEAAASRPPGQDEITLRAARLGITPERVLQEYARIAFADLRRFVDWGPNGLVPKNSAALSEEDAAAISEIVSGGTDGKYRIKLYDKKSALNAIARHLGMFVRAAPRPEDAPDTIVEDALEVLARRLARLAAGGAEE
jgi:hypothetical protein